MLHTLRRLLRGPLSVLLTLGGSLALLLFLAALLAPGSLTLTAKVTGGLNYSVDWSAIGSQMSSYLKQVSTGNLGLNAQGKPVVPVVLEALGRSLTLLLPAVALAAGLGVAKGVYDFRRQARPRTMGGLTSIALQTLPDFLAAIGLQYLMIICYFQFDWKPFPLTYKSDQHLASLVLPILSLTFVPGGFIARLTALFLTEVYGEDYIRTARSKGVSEAKVVWKHAFKNVLVQLLDALPGLLLALASNLIVVESFVYYPGLATLLLEAIGRRGVRFTGVGWGAAGGADLPTLVIGGLIFVLLFTAMTALIRLGRRLVDRRLANGGDGP